MKRFFARNRKYTLIFIDAGFVLVSYLAAILLFQTGQMSDSMFRAFELTVLLSALLCVLLFFLCNIYRNILLYSSVREYTVICLAVILKMTVMINLKLYTDLNLLPIPYIILSSLILMKQGIPQTEKDPCSRRWMCGEYRDERTSDEKPVSL